MTVATLKAKLLTKTRLYYNDGQGGGNSPPPPPPPPPASPPPPPPASPPPPPPGNGEPKFTQADVDRMMAEHRKGLQKTNQELIEQLEQLRQSANLTAQQKEEVEARIQTLSQQHLTKEQQAQEEYTKLKKKYEKETKELAEREVTWKSRFENTLIDNAIAVGASEHNARSAKQLQMMFRSQAKVVEVVDEGGKPTGVWEARLPVEVVDPKTKQKTVLELPIPEALGKLKEVDEFANLFNTDGRSGFGGNNYGGRNGSGANGGSNGTLPDFSKMSPEEFAEWRKKQPNR